MALYFNDVSLGASGLSHQPLVKKLTAIRVAAAGFFLDADLHELGSYNSAAPAQRD